MKNWLDRSIGGERFTKVAGIFQPPPVQTEMAMEYVRDFISRFGDRFERYDAMASDMYRFADRLMFQNRRKLSGSDPWDIMDEVDRYVTTGRYDGNFESPNKDKWYYGPIRERALLNSSKLPIPEDQLTYKLGGLDISGWRYEKRIGELSESEEGRKRLEDLESDEVILRISLLPGDGYFSNERPGTEAVVGLPDHGYRNDTMLVTALHEMSHYGQACMNYMVHGEFDVYLGAGSPNMDSLYDYHEMISRIRGNIGGFGRGEMRRDLSRMHTNTPAEFYPNLIGNMKSFIDGFDRSVESGSHWPIKQKIEDLEQLAHRGNYGSIPGIFGIDEIRDSRMKYKITNEILKAIDDWLKTPNGRKYLEDPDKKPPPNKFPPRTRD